MLSDGAHRYFREVRCFFTWLVESDALERSPFRGMRNVRLPQRIVQPFSGEDVMRLLAACPETPLGRRDRAMVHDAARHGHPLLRARPDQYRGPRPR